MTRAEWPQPPFVIFPAMSSSDAVLFTAARPVDVQLLRLDLFGVSERSELVARIAEAFNFPPETSGLDATLDWLSDLEWLGKTEGYLLVVDHLESTPDPVQRDLAGLLPDVIDRWRTRAIPFVVVLVGQKHHDVVRIALDEANDGLAEFAQLSWAQPGTGPVDIIDCG